MTKPDEIKTGLSSIIKRYQLINDTLDIYDKNGDQKIDLKKEADPTDASIGVFNALDSIKRDGFITIEEMAKTFSDPSMIWLFVQSSTPMLKLWSANSVRVESENKESKTSSFYAKYFATRMVEDNDLLSNSLPIINAIDSHNAELFLQKLSTIGLEYRGACSRSKLPSMKEDFDWILNLFRNDSSFEDEFLFEPESINKVFESMDIIAKWLKGTDDIESLKRNIYIMIGHSGFDTIISHNNIINSLNALRKIKPSEKSNYLVVFDRKTLEARIVTLQKGKIYTTTPDEAVIGSRIWDESKPPVNKFSTPHFEKTMEMVPWFITMGDAYLENTIDKVIKYIEENNIASKVHKGKLISDIDRNFIRKLIYVEISGDKLYEAGEAKDWNKVDTIINSILFRLGTYEKDAFHETESNKGAKGMCQIIPGTYNGLQKKYGHIIEDFHEGTTDHFNAILTQFMLIDDIMKTFDNRIGNSYKEHRDMLVERIKDPEIFGQFIAISYNAGGFGFRWLAGLENLTLGSQADGYRRKYTVISKFFELKPFLPLINASEVLNKILQTKLEPYLNSLQTILPELQKMPDYFKSLLTYINN